MHCNTNTARRTLLARRSRPGILQAGSVSSSLSAGHYRNCQTTAHWSPVLPSTANLQYTSLPSQHLRQPCLFSRRPHSLELSPGFHPGPDHQCRVFQTFALNVFVRSILVHSAR